VCLPCASRNYLWLQHLHSVLPRKCLRFRHLTTAASAASTAPGLSGDGKAEAGGALRSLKVIHAQCMACVWQVSGETPMTLPIVGMA